MSLHPASAIVLLVVGPWLSPLYHPAVSGWTRFGKQLLLCFAWQPATVTAEGRCMHRSRRHWREGEQRQLKSTILDQLQSLSQYLKGGVWDWFIALLAWAITKAHT